MKAEISIATFFTALFLLSVPILADNGIGWGNWNWWGLNQPTLPQNASQTAVQKTSNVFDDLGKKFSDIFSANKSQSVPSQENFQQYNQTEAQPTNVNDNGNSLFGQIRSFFSRLFGGR